MEKILFLLRHIPGAGSSTTARILSENDKYPIFAADDYFYDDNSVYNFDVNKLNIAHKTCINNVELFMHKTNRIFVTNTFTTEKELKPYYQLAEKYGFNVISLIVENRHNGESIHNVPEETIKKMKNRFAIKL